MQNPFSHLLFTKSLKMIKSYCRSMRNSTKQLRSVSNTEPYNIHLKLILFNIPTDS